jgi:hypothetical protein
MGGGGSKQTPTGVVPGGERSGGGSAGGDDGGGADAYSGGVRQNAASTLEEFEMDDEVAQQTADLLFDLLPYYGTGNAEADQIFLATLQANDILAHSRDAHGNTLLMIACQASKQDIINLMIEKEVDVNAQNYMGVTALHIVCYDATSESYSMCERLIQAGAGIDAADAEGCTPLHYAASGGHASLVALLLMYGAEAGRQDAMGYTAQDYAVQSNHMEVVQLLFHTGSEDMSGQEKANDGTSTGTAGEAKATAGEDELAKASEELWQEYIDPASGCPYYYNMLTGETTWERPASFKPATVVSAIASAAAEAKKKKIDEKIQDARADGELGAAFLLERWRRVAWREGMRRVVANQKKAQRKFALAQAKARAYLLQQGGEASDAAVKQMNISKKEAAELKEKLASNNAANSVGSQEMEELKRQLAEKDKALGGMSKQMELMGASQMQDLKDQFESEKARALEEMEARHAAKLNELGGAVQAKDGEMASMRMKLEAAEAGAASQKKELSLQAQQAAIAAERKVAAQIAEMKAQLAAKDKALSSVTNEVTALRKDAAANTDAQARLKDLAQQKDALEKEKQVMALELSNLKDENKRLRRDYLKEQNLRRKYHNEVEDLKGAIRVFSRCRPISSSETERGNVSVAAFPDEFSICLTSDDKKKTFEFDKSFSPESTQEDVFADTKRLVQSAVDGYNVCIFAYGQTGSGKTYTMMGPPDSMGLTPRVCKEIFRLARRDKSKLKFNVKFYMCELYKDDLVDLLSTVSAEEAVSSGSKLTIKKDTRGVVRVDGATERTCASADDLMCAIEDGSNKRQTASTLMNSESSRSHLVMGIILEVTNLTTNVTTVGKLSLVDLAGSERVGKTGAEGERFEEAKAINKSLSALGDVIGALTSGQKHIPYRNHKLTMLLSDSLGGNAKTLMFVNVSPVDYNFAETSNSLSFASRVKKVVNNSSKSIETKEIKQLKKQLMMLKVQLGMGGDKKKKKKG